MPNVSPNPRKPDTEIDPMFLDRWSPRNMDETPLTDEEAASLFEAARWAPSCFNEQPWVFVFAKTPEDRARFASALTEKNRVWASSAPLLIFVLARKSFTLDGRGNKFAPFDAGAAWMSLALQARKRGLYAHAMGGFNEDKVRDMTDADAEKFSVLAAIAVGRRKEAVKAGETSGPSEFPSDRRKVKDFLFEGRLHG